MPLRERRRELLRWAILSGKALGYEPSTSRSTLLALAEIRRRYDDDSQRTDGLSPYELKVFSQNGEDGVLAEIIRRSGISGRTFVEIGAATGVENNTALLADAFGWSGTLIEGAPDNHGRLTRKYGPRPDIETVSALVTPQNVNELLPDRFDLLSIDVDGADYWIWQAIDFNAAVVVIEYNSSLGSDRRLVQPSGGTVWDGTEYFGASIAALEELGRSKGYRLVHTEMTGLNAFFVRDDVPGEYPPPPSRGTSFHLIGEAHPPDELGRQYVDLDA